MGRSTLACRSCGHHLQQVGDCSGQGHCYKPRSESIQAELAAFIADHNVGCFVCETTTATRWAKTGVSRYGPWAICMACVKANRHKQQLELQV